MNLRRHLPSPDLKPFLRDIIFIESDAATRNLILPDTSLVLAIRYKGSVSQTVDSVDQILPLATLSGTRRSPRHVAYSANAANLLIRFEPGGAAAFFREPLNEFFQQTIPATYLKGFSDLNNIGERLTNMTTNTQRAVFIQEFLLTQLKTSAPDPLIHSAIQTIQRSKGTLHINDLAKQLYISQDAFEKRFRRSIGMTAKHFSSTLRIRNAIDSYSPSRTLTDLAHSAGYFDQAHFSHDFQRFTGQPPRQFFTTANYW